VGGDNLFQFALVRNREFLTAFGTTARQHFAAIGSSHALAESMYGLATTTMRLKCTFHILLAFSRLPRFWRRLKYDPGERTWFLFLRVTTPTGL
jgi:hypothetical protein